MSNRRRPRPRPSLPVTKLRSPSDVITMVPYLLGFEPAESLVLVALEGERRRFGPCARLDLVDDSDPAGPAEPSDPPDYPAEYAEYVSTLVAHHAFDPVILVAFSTRKVFTDEVMAAVLDQLDDDGVEVVEAVRADGRRWWSYVCVDPVCCPPEGTAYDPGSSRVAAEAVVAGLSRAPNRDALRAQFEPDPQSLAVMAGALRGRDGDPALEPAAAAALVRRMVADPDEVTAQDRAALVQAVQDIPARDAAWELMTREAAADHFMLWTDLMRAVPDPLMAPVGSLAAFAGWLMGRGVLASHAAERVLAVHPGYSMARLMLDLCAASVPPTAWSQVRAQLPRAAS